MIEACVFDLDGTLINSLEDLADSSNFALAALGYSTHTTEEYRYFVGHGAGHLVESMLPQNARTPEVIEKTMSLYRDRYAAHSLDKTRPYPGVPELIAGLRQKGIKCAVVSNKPDSDTRAIIESLFDATLFNAVTGHREGVPHKPEPQVVLNTCKELRCKPASCVMLGDSAVDIQTGCNAGMTPVGVLWGFRGRDELLKAGAKYLIKTADGLWDVLKQLNAR